MTECGEWTTSTSGLPLGMDDGVAEHRSHAAERGRSEGPGTAADGSVNGQDDAAHASGDAANGPDDRSLGR